VKKEIDNNPAPTSNSIDLMDLDFMTSQPTTLARQSRVSSGTLRYVVRRESGIPVRGKTTGCLGELVPADTPGDIYSAREECSAMGAD
jgi:hypothetical protein